MTTGLLEPCKVCPHCGLEKVLHAFPRNKNRADGYGGWCKPCVNAAKASWVKRNTGKVMAADRAWRAANPEKARRKVNKWRAANPEKNRAINAAWMKQHPEKMAAHQSNRRAKQFRATPKWNIELSELVVAEAHALVRARLKTTGVKWHVDHTVPLRSKFVCGLHTASNMRVILAAENISKGNRYWPDMP